MKINVKNNSTANVQKINIIREFFKFCQTNSPLKNSINFVFVDKTNETFFDGKYLLPLKTVNLSENLNLVSQMWTNEFSKQRNIPCGYRESQLLVSYFIKNNPSVSKLLNL